MEEKKCAFRLDDITADMNWGNFNRICGIFDKYQVKPLLGVVPQCRDSQLHIEESRPGFFDVLRCLQEKGYVMAQHGCTHVYETDKSGLLKLNPFSEFAGLTYEKQEGKIRKGKQILQKEGIYVTIFMAPGHTYDRNTLRALKKQGFTHITDGFANHIYRYGGLIHIPSRQSKPGLEHGIDTICLHPNTMTNNDFEQLERFIRDNRKAVTDYVTLLMERACPKGPLIRLEEKRNLYIRRLKRFASTNGAVQDYMAATFDADAGRKRRKRLQRLPQLCMELLAGWRKRK